jgi:hypothetical protein
MKACRRTLFRTTCVLVIRLQQPSLEPHRCSFLVSTAPSLFLRLQANRRRSCASILVRHFPLQSFELRGIRLLSGAGFGRGREHDRKEILFRYTSFGLMTSRGHSYVFWDQAERPSL